MLFPIVLFILPAFFVIVLVPGMLSLLRDLRGWGVVGVKDRGFTLDAGAVNFVLRTLTSRTGEGGIR